MVRAQAIAESDQLADIIVTAQKRSEDSQKAALSVDTVKPEDLQNSGVRSAVDIEDILPVVKFGGAEEATVAIRGLSTIDLNAGVDSSIAYNQDGIYLAHPAALSPILFDIDRVEAVLGPQGTLYGRNSNGGVINFLTNRPTFKFGGDVQLGGGNYGAVNSEAAINLPVSDTVAFRIAAASDRHTGYNRDGGDDAENYAARAKLLYQPNEAFSALLTIDGSRSLSNAQQRGWVCPPGLIGVPACTGVNNAPYSGFNPPAKSDRYSNNIYGLSADLEYNLGWAELTSLSGYKRYRYESVLGAGWIGGVNNFDFDHFETDRLFTQEFRIAASPTSPIRWVAGAYYSREEQPYLSQFNFYTNTVVQVPPPFGPGAPPNFFLSFPVSDTLYQSEAVFGDVTIPIVESVRFRGGLRYTHESKTALGLSQEGIVGIGIIGTSENPSEEKASRVTWKAGMDWDITPQNLLYITGSDGYKSGGLNDLPAASGLTTYRPETITAVELGSKNRFLENRLQVNLSVFHYDYHGYQEYIFYSPQFALGAPLNLAGSTFFPTVNSQKATFEGGELSLLWKVTQSDLVSLNWNYLNDIFDEFVLSEAYTPTFNLSGQTVPEAPRNNVTIGYQHEFALAGDNKLTFGGSTNLVSDAYTYGQYMGSRLYTQKAYHKTRLEASFSTPSQWKILAYVRNLENKATINTVSNGYASLENAAQVNADLDPPRVYGITIRKDF